MLAGAGRQRVRAPSGPRSRSCPSMPIAKVQSIMAFFVLLSELLLGKHELFTPDQQPRILPRFSLVNQWVCWASYRAWREVTDRSHRTVGGPQTAPLPQSTPHHGCSLTEAAPELPLVNLPLAYTRASPGITCTCGWTGESNVHSLRERSVLENADSPIANRTNKLWAQMQTRARSFDMSIQRSKAVPEACGLTGTAMRCTDLLQQALHLSAGC